MKDLDPVPIGSSPEQFIEVNGTTFFLADDGIHGRELWKTDGTPEGTTLVKDIEAGLNGLQYAALAHLNDTLYFTTVSSHGSKLWKSDGTEAGTVPVANIGSGDQRLEAVGNFAVVNDTLYFVGRFQTGSWEQKSDELWKSNGTPEGTGLVKVLRADASLTTATPSLTAAGSRLFLSVADQDHGSELWISDGTEAGTLLLKDINPGAAGSSIAHMLPVGDRLFFSADDGVHGQELWVSDGTEAGTFLVNDIGPWKQGSNPTDLCKLGDTIYFAAYSGVRGFELWKSDGTAEGTAMVSGLPAAYRPGYPKRLVSARGGVYFLAFDNYGLKLWRSDGTSEGTVPVGDLGQNRVAPDSPLLESGGNLYFVVETLAEGRQLWRSDGTPEGTIKLINDRFASYGSLSAFGNRLLFAANQISTGMELWISNGTPSGTGLLKDIRPGTESGSPWNLIAWDDALLFTRRDGIWKSDGTSTGTAPLLGSPSEPIGSMVATENGVFLILSSQLWITDGTRAGSRPLLKNGWIRKNFGVFDNRLFFTNYRAGLGEELWVSDGTPQGTIRLKSASGNANIPARTELVDVYGVLYFAMSPNSDRSTAYLWKTDGTPEGTTQVSDVPLVISAESKASMANLNGTLFFAGSMGDNQGLWKTDGTAAGTVLVKDLGSQGAEGLVSVDGTLYFRAHDEEHGWELWKSDGTPSGTVLVKDIAPGRSDSRPDQFIALNGRVFFVADDGSLGQELWSTDGTEAGTVLVRDILPGQAGSQIRSMIQVGEVLFFSAEGQPGDRELWRTDGTLEGTRLVRDIRPGLSPSSPRHLTKVGNTLFFSADDGLHGFELWAVAPPVADAGGPYNVAAGSYFQLDGRRSSDPDPVEMLIYEWDLDGDGIFGEVGSAADKGDELGATCFFDAVLLWPGTHTISLRVTNSAGLSSTATTTVTVHEPAFTGTPEDDLFTIRLDDFGDVQFIGGQFGSPGVTLPRNMVHSVRLAGNGGHDVLIVDRANGDPLRNAALHIDSGTIRLQAANGPDVGLVSYLQIDAGATLDLADNRLVIFSASHDRDRLLSQLYTHARSAYGSVTSPWRGPGLTSSTAAANPHKGLVITPNDRGDGQLLDPSLDANAILVQCSYNGDFNLDGKVDASDYFHIDKGFLDKATGHHNGDINYDGKIDASDYFLIDKSFLVLKATPNGPNPLRTEHPIASIKPMIPLASDGVPRPLEHLFAQQPILA